jgi:hydrogenase maturation protein HypF
MILLYNKVGIKMDALTISITGVVQGVGFRPFVYGLAGELSIKGHIANTTDGVLLAVEGDNLHLFVERLRVEAPPLARIMGMEISPAEFSGFHEFSILESSGTGRFTHISPDISVCSDCLDELMNPHDRRFLYPFINCTNCGPRYSIIKKVPYDRANTTMDIFAMCEACSAEYHDLSDRRFHAQPNACAVCGPQLELVIPCEEKKLSRVDDPVRATRHLLSEGKIIAIKGLGGFHLACDATNREAVLKLRKRKRKSNKPFALMAADIETIRRYCFVSETEEEALLSPKRPIALLKKLEGQTLPGEIAQDNRYTGFMLPYTPVHYLLFCNPEGDGFNSSDDALSVLVMTSGNLSEEPVIHENEEAYLKLSSVADAFLVHNRDIFMRVDDSVIKIINEGSVSRSEGSECRSFPDISRVTAHGSRMSFIRRSRGYIPEPIPLPDDGPDILACGADLKNTLAIAKGGYAILSQHIGDMESYETLRFFEETFENLKSVYRVEPQAVAYDLHPEYLSGRWGQRFGEKTNIKSIPVQHHYAHIGSVMAEYGLSEKVIGVAFDGVGYGDDGSLWGGEFFIADLNGYKRAGHIRYTPLPGGDMAAREPWRMAISCLYEAAGREVMDFLKPAGFPEKYGKETVERMIKIASDRKFSPLSSSAGRLFDAVSALIGVCDRNTFEGEAAIALESLVLQGIREDYPLDISFKDKIEIDFSHAFLRIVDDMGKDPDRSLVATKFHNTVASAIISVVLKLSLVNNIRKVVLSGGVFQNMYLLGQTIGQLRSEGMQVFINGSVPCNDGGISLGQAYIARERMKTGTL